MICIICSYLYLYLVCQSLSTSFFIEQMIHCCVYLCHVLILNLYLTFMLLFTECLDFQLFAASAYQYFFCFVFSANVFDIITNGEHSDIVPLHIALKAPYCYHYYNYFRMPAYCPCNQTYELQFIVKFHAGDKSTSNNLMLEGHVFMISPSIAKAT